MLKRWDTRNYDVELVLKIFDSIDIDFDSMDIPKPKVHDIRTITKALIVKEELSLRATEVRVEKLLGVRIRSSLPGEETGPLHGGNSQCNFKRASQNRIFGENFADSTVFTNKKEIGAITRYNRTLYRVFDKEKYRRP